MSHKGICRVARRGWAQAGLTLVELMIAMFLGLLVVGGVVSVILANSQTYRTNQGLFQVQESARTAFELLARDIRQGAGTACGNAVNQIGNTLSGADDPNDTGYWWKAWRSGMEGYAGGDAAPAVAFGDEDTARAEETDAILLHDMEGTGFAVGAYNSADRKLTIAAATDFAVNDILLVCKHDRAAIFQVSAYDGSDPSLRHEAGIDLCSNPPTVPCFGPNSTVARKTAVTWYIGQNGRAEEGGRSLYRMRLGAAASVASEEIVAGVTDMQLRYRQGTATTFVDAGAVTNWGDVTAVQVTLTLRSADQRLRLATDNTVNDGRLERTFTTIVGLRNRVG